MENKQAYCLGFLLGDSSITKTGRLSMVIAIQDKSVVYFMKTVYTNALIKESYIKDVKRKIFPNIKISINKIDFPEALMLFGGLLKEERHIPILKKDLDLALLNGFFDAEGCITWGYRKDRDRLWQKVSFSSQYKMLIGIQKILIKNNISSIIKPVKDSKHFIIEFSNEEDVYKLYKILYSNNNFFYLNRKKENFETWIKALKIKYDFKIGDIVKPCDIRTIIKFLSDKIVENNKNLINLKEVKYKEFVIDKIENDDIYLKNLSFPINKYCLTKKGMNLTPLRIELGELLETS